jgi:hypothetical protein
VSWGVDHYTSVSVSRDGRRITATVASPTTTLWSVPILEREVLQADVQALSVPTMRPGAAHQRRIRVLPVIAPGRRSVGRWRNIEARAQRPPATIL